jgi:hypothetical protein
MTTLDLLSPAAFERLVDDQASLVRAVNDLEMALYDLGEEVADPQVARCRDVAGALIGRLRASLFDWDQQCLPRLEPGDPAPDLARVVASWNQLMPPTRTAILALVDEAKASERATA